MTTGTRKLLITLALVAGSLAAYAPALRHAFVNFDDDLYVSGNPRVLGGLTADNVCWAWTTLHAGYYQPVTWMSFQLDAQLFGPGPWGFHLTNIILHAVNAALLFWALDRLTGAVWRSAAVAAFFALHPLHVESVAWVSERKDVLSTFFAILTLWAYAAYAERAGPARFLAVLTAFTLGLLAKPMLVTLPCALLLLDFWPLRRLDGSRGSVRLVALEKLPLFALAAGMSALTIHAQHAARAMLSLDRVSLGTRIANALVGYVWYLEKTVWPFDMAPIYPYPGNSLSGWQVGSAAGLLAAVTVFTVALAWRRPYLVVGWLWFMGTLVPVIGFLQSGEQPVADRFAYLPHIGLFIAIVWGAADLAAYARWPWQAVAAVTAALLLGCGLRAKSGGALAG